MTKNSNQHVSKAVDESEVMHFFILKSKFSIGYDMILKQNLYDLLKPLTLIINQVLAIGNFSNL